MNNILFSLFNITFTGWKIVGYLGLLMFSSRWIVQLYFSRKLGRSVITSSFWILSIMGSFFLLVYFIFGKNDSVGTLSNLFPVIIALYNLLLDKKYKKTTRSLSKKSNNLTPKGIIKTAVS